ncbi:butyrate kinase [Candidatus Venteria ishoeyi]|uniref:Probable butyrate kinase n=1 Tax=Candidatus Venteria ishoeyi TaxID=1899563 RepID=A0A1H6F8F9_9GAMM|nr:butyrate kinase [Candidatus Venteria ishoeyi]SEH05356.1 Butyrate kinase 2 [Candidatus Venteria ishoeyi]
MENVRILCLKPEFFQTKAAIYQGGNMLFLKSIKHPKEKLESFEKVTDQHQYRAEEVLHELKEADIRIDLIRVVIGRGGLLKPIPSGIYMVNDRMKEDLVNSSLGAHSVNLGGLIADDLSKMLPDAKAYIADPVVVDEMEDIARVTGWAEFQRHSVFHALTQKAIARRHAKAVLQNYEEMNLIVANLGEGISIGAHKQGKVVDVNQAFDGEGPFSLERAGSLPLGNLVKMCFSGKYTEKEVMWKIRAEGGMMSHCKTRSLYEIEEMIDEGNEDVIFVFKAMAYQVSKYIGSLIVALKGKVDGIILTGMIAHNKMFTDFVIEHIGNIASVHIYPGECISDGLAMNAQMMLKGEIEAKEYL